MGDGQEQDHHEERLKEVFNSFDANGCGTLSPKELSELCQSLQLDDTTPAVLHALQQNLDQPNARVDFEQFKNALILVLSSAVEPPEEQQSLPEQESPEIQPKYVKGTKRYGRRSTPEFLEPLPDLPDVASRTSAAEKDFEDNCDSAVPRKRERWNGYKTRSEEYEAEGQMHLWNPDEPSTPRSSIVPLSARLEESLREACEELSIMWDGCAGHSELLSLCEHLGLEINEDVLLSLTGDGAMNVQDFVSRVVIHNKPPTPSASTPYRQLKRLHSTQPFDEGGRRIVTPSALTCSIGMRLFSTLDDGSGFIPAEYILDAWIEEGIENGAEILQTLNFDLDGKLSLGDLTMALENELLVTKNGAHQAALASFKAEIRHLLERVDREIREKDKIRSDLEKAERLKMQFASEVDEHHAAIEHMNNLNLRKLEQEHKEKLVAVRSELMKEMDQIQQQAGLQREELETEIQKIREDESFLREHLSISVKENRRIEMDLLDSTEKLVEAQSQISKLQTHLDNIMKDKFGDLDPNSADFLLQEERIKQLRTGYETQIRELQDRIDELQSELQEFHNLGPAHQSCKKPLSEELESKSPGMESDPGIGSEEVQPFSMSLEAEMVLEQLKEQHLHEMEDLRNQLENKIAEFEKIVEKQRLSHEDQNSALSLQYQQEIQALQGEIASVQSHARKLQSQLDQAEQEQRCMERQQVAEREELDSLQEKEVGDLRQQLLEAHNSAADLEKQLKALEMQQAERAEDLHTEMENLREKHLAEVRNLKDEHAELLKARLAEQRKELLDERLCFQQSLLDGCEKEKKLLHKSHEEKIEELRLSFEEERNEVVKNLMEQWQREKAQLDEQNSESLQVLLEEEMLRLVKDQEDKQSRLKEQWDQERARLLEQQEKALYERLREERLQFEQRERKMREEWETEKLQLEEDYEGMIQDRLNEEKEMLKNERDEEERRVEKLMAEEKDRLEQRHREAMTELRAIHAEERDALSATLDKLRDDITQERKEIESSFNQKIREVGDRFSGSQECVEARFQADVSKLEQHYQSELKVLSDSHRSQKNHWEAQMQEALESLDEQRKVIKESMEQERDRLIQEWTGQQQELERVHNEEVEALILQNKKLRSELDEMISKAQTKEIDLSMQLNDLHHRLQESLKTKHDLLSQSENKALEIELLLNQSVEDFKQERAELQSNNVELEAKYQEMLSLSERQIAERIELITERDDLRMKIEELEMLLKRAAEDFEQERNELQENLLVLEKMLKYTQIEVDEVKAERDALNGKVEELEMQPREDLRISNEKSSHTEDDASMPGDANIYQCEQDNDKGDSAHERGGRKPQENLSFLATVLEEMDREELRAEGDLQPEEVSDFAQTVAMEEILESSATERFQHTDNYECLSGEPHFLQAQGEGEYAVYDDADVRENVKQDRVGDGPLASGDQTEQDETDGSNNQEKAALSVETAETRDIRPENIEVPPERADLHVGVGADLQIKSSTPERACLCHESCESFPRKNRIPDNPEKHHTDENGALGLKMQQDLISSLEAFADPENNTLNESCSDQTRPQDAGTVDCGNSFQEIGLHHEVLAESFSPEETGDPDEACLEDLEVDCLSDNSHDSRKELASISKCEHLTTEIRHRCAHDCVHSDGGHQRCPLLKLQTLFTSAMEENFLLHEKISLLQQKTEILEHLLAHNTEKIKTGHQVLEENYSLKVKMLLLMELVKEMEMKALKMTDLQIRYEDCLCDNVKLKDYNAELERRVWLMEGRMNILPKFQDEQVTLVDEVNRMREETMQRSDLFMTLDQQEEILLEGVADAEFPNPDKEPEEEAQAAADLQDCCLEFEKHNSKLRQAITELQDKSQTLNETTQAHRSEASRLAEENIVLKQKIAAMTVEDLKEIQELTQTVEHLNKEKFGTQKAAETFHKQISELRLQNQQLHDANRILLEKNAQNASDVESLRQQLHQLTEDSERREAFPAEERNKVKLTDENLHCANRQSARLKSDLRVVQQEKDSLKREVTVLHKQLQNTKDKNNVLEKALHSSGLQSPSKRPYRDETSHVLEQEQQLLRQENDRLQAEVRSVKGDLIQSEEKVRQLDATILSLKQHKQPSHSTLVKMLEEENIALKQELEAEREQNKSCEAGQRQTELEGLQQENEALKAQMARLSTQLIETFHAQLVGLLPSSPHRIPRGQHHGEDPDNMQGPMPEQRAAHADSYRRIGGL